MYITIRELLINYYFRMANYNSVDFKIGRLFGVLCNNEDLDFNTFIYKLNEYKGDLIISIELLEDICNLYCSDVVIINYRNREIVVVGSVMGIVYYCETDKTVKKLDYDEYDEEELNQLLNKEEDEDDIYDDDTVEYNNLGLNEEDDIDLYDMDL
jgi:hypothetical protein